MRMPLQKFPKVGSQRCDFGCALSFHAKEYLRGLLGKVKSEKGILWSHNCLPGGTQSGSV